MNFSRYNQDFMDTMALVSFIIGILNYGENLSQSDKGDLMQSLDEKTNSLLTTLESDLEYQNDLLNKILIRLDNIERKI